MELSAWIALGACVLSGVLAWIARGAALRGGSDAKTAVPERSAASPPTPRDVIERLELVELKVGSLAREQIAFLEDAEVILAGVERKRKQRASIDARNVGGQPDLPIEPPVPTREERKAIVRAQMGKVTH